jgi:hypothetical protein
MWTFTGRLDARRRFVSTRALRSTSHVLSLIVVGSDGTKTTGRTCYVATGMPGALSSFRHHPCSCAACPSFQVLTERLTQVMTSAARLSAAQSSFEHTRSTAKEQPMPQSRPLPIVRDNVPVTACGSDGKSAEAVDCHEESPQPREPTAGSPEWV